MDKSKFNNTKEYFLNFIGLCSVLRDESLFVKELLDALLRLADRLANQARKHFASIS